MNRRTFFVLFALASAASLEGKQKNGKARRAKGGRAESHRFLARDRDIIVGYYSGEGGLPPGLAKRGGDLPPGLEKQLRRNGRLPPGLEKKLAPFPAELDARLPPCPPDYGRFQIGMHVVLMHRRTQVIADIFALR